MCLGSSRLVGSGRSDSRYSGHGSSFPLSGLSWSQLSIIQGLPIFDYSHPDDGSREILMCALGLPSECCYG